MSAVHLQIRNLGDETHRALKARAALEGRSLSDMIREELDRMAARPSRREVLRRIAERGHPPLDEPVADTVRRMRDDA
jgi:plasmid stability protein